VTFAEGLPVAAALPLQDPPADAGRPPPPANAAPVLRPKPPRIEEMADAGPLAAMPASAILGDTEPEDPEGRDSQ
jgi:hypothetical protein